MPLCTPILQGPLSEWNNSLLVEGALPGSTVVARAISPNPRELAKEVVGGGRDRLPLLPGVKLQEKDHIVVKQTLGSEQSEWTPAHLAVAVGKAPTQHAALAPLSFRSRAWQCGARVWVKGAVPGAQVEVTGPGGMLASGRASEGGDARLPLNTNLPAPGQAITASQQAPVGFPPLVGSPQLTLQTVDKLPVPPGQKLPPPKLGGSPPRGCDRSMLIAGVFDGAEVTVTRASDGSSQVATFDLDTLNFVFGAPLRPAGDQLKVIQAMPRCRERFPSDPLEVAVASMPTPAPPSVLPPCADSVDVFAQDLEPGALVSLTYKNQTYRGMVPPTASSFVFRLAPLQADESIAVRQERCGLKSDAATVTVKGANLIFGLVPDLVDPLVGCARAVRVTTIPGTWLQLWAAESGGVTPISSQVFATLDSIRIEVSPYLQAGQEVWLSYLLCGGGAWAVSRHHFVVPTPDVGPANFTHPLVEGATSVNVDAIPGAGVDVYAVRGMPLTVEHVGAGLVDPLQKNIGLTRPLSQQDLVYAEQRLCSHRPGVGAARTVLPGLRHFTLAMPLKRPSHSKLEPLVCQSAQIVLRHNGWWDFTAFLENQETESDCSFDLQFQLLGVTAAFGAVLKGSLSAKDSKTGLALYGIPSSKAFATQDHFQGFLDPLYWEEVLGASHKFDLFVAWTDLPGPPEADDADGD